MYELIKEAIIKNNLASLSSLRSAFSKLSVEEQFCLFKIVYRADQYDLSEAIINEFLTFKCTFNCSQWFRSELYYGWQNIRLPVLEWVLKEKVSAPLLELHLDSFNIPAEVFKVLLKYGFYQITCNRVSSNDLINSMEKKIGRALTVEYLFKSIDEYLKQDEAHKLRHSFAFLSPLIRIKEGAWSDHELNVIVAAFKYCGHVDIILILDLAIRTQNATLVTHLLKSVSDEGRECLLKHSSLDGVMATAASQRNIEIVQLLLDYNAALINPTEPYHTTTPLIEAARQGSEDIASFLLDRGALINPKDKATTPLIEAVKSGNIKLMGLLLARGALVEPENKNTTPLMEAVKQGNATAALLLLEHGAVVNPIGRKRTPLVEAVRKGSEACVRLLLSKGARFNFVDECNDGALTAAAASGNVTIIQLLLAQGAIFNLTDKIAPLLVAARAGKAEAIQALMEYERQRNPQANLSTLDIGEFIGRDSVSVVRVLNSYGAYFFTGELFFIKSGLEAIAKVDALLFSTLLRSNLSYQPDFILHNELIALWYPMLLEAGDKDTIEQLIRTRPEQMAEVGVLSPLNTEYYVMILARNNEYEPLSKALETQDFNKTRVLTVALLYLSKSNAQQLIRAHHQLVESDPLLQILAKYINEEITRQEMVRDILTNVLDIDPHNPVECLATTVGIEWEFFGVVENPLIVTLMTEVAQLICKEDGSIRPDNDTRGLEYVTGILSTEVDLKRAFFGLNLLNILGARVNNSCGLHMHLGVLNYNNIPADVDKAAFRLLLTKNFAKLYYQSFAPILEGILRPYGFFAKNSAAQFSEESKAFYIKVDNCNSWWDLARLLQGFSEEKPFESQMRYFCMNIIPMMQRNGYGTIELRHHDASLDPSVVKSRMNSLLKLFTAAVNGTTTQLLKQSQAGSEWTECSSLVRRAQQALINEGIIGGYHSAAAAAADHRSTMIGHKHASKRPKL